VTTLHAAIFANDALIGHADLRAYDPALGIYGGRFYPGEGYGAIRPIVMELMQEVWTRGRTADAGRLAGAYQRHDALTLEVRTPEGEPLHPATVHLEDASGTWRDGEPRIELVGLPSEEAMRFFDEGGGE
jgi:hypothetical protein